MYIICMLGLWCIPQAQCHSAACQMLGAVSVPCLRSLGAAQIIMAPKAAATAYTGQESAMFHFQVLLNISCVSCIVNSEF